MKIRTGVSLIVGSAFALTACTSFHKSGNRGVASLTTTAFAPGAAKKLSDAEIAQYASSEGLEIQNARVIKDNFESYKSKRDIIRKAERKLSLVYYIYSDDYSTSEFSSELIAAARRGVQVDLLVDFITNYERLDLFRYLEQEGKKGKGSLTVKFYGIPNQKIREGAVYQTIPCRISEDAKKEEDSCKDAKMALLKEMGNPEQTWFSTMYLTGLYGKNQVLMGTSTQLGGEFDPKALKPKDDSQKIPAEDAKKLGKLMIDAKIKNDFGSKLKLGFAMASHGDAIGPIMNEFTGRLPIPTGGGDEWDHLTDYTHHKLIIADGVRFQLGGRNVEDSYHTEFIKKQFPQAKGKYTFMDTDFYGEGAKAQQIEDAYQRLFSFGAQVGGFAEVDRYVPNDYDANTDAFQETLYACLQKPELMQAVGGQIEKCVDTNMKGHPKYRTLQARLLEVGKSMVRYASEFKKYKPSAVEEWLANGIGPKKDGVDLTGAQVYYIENISFNKNDSNKRRLFGSKIGQENKYGKGIHALWARGIENTCATATKENPKRVILHSAYFIMPTPLLNAMAKAINGTWDCRNVSIEIVTNSAQTTDLAPVNLFARNQLAALFRFDWQNSNQERKAKLEYYEYVENYAPVVGRSLHSKNTVLGDDIIIGSANADVRSYHMDTNNGVFIRGAKNLVKDYIAHIDELKNANSQKLSIWPRGFYIFKFNEKGEVIGQDAWHYSAVTPELLDIQTEIFLQASANRWLSPKEEDMKGMSPEDKEKYLAEKKANMDSFTLKKPALKKAIAERGEQIDKVTTQILQRSGLGSEEDQAELEDIANKFDDLWKVL
jgi:putative cardiolipin synthase